MKCDNLSFLATQNEITKLPARKRYLKNSYVQRRFGKKIDLDNYQ